MPQPKQGPRLASSPAHERLMLANMCTSLYRNGSITTTLPKAKRVRPLAERLITFAKRGDLAHRRRVLRVVRDKSVVHRLFTVIAKQMENRDGGYTRIVKLAPRRGDNATQAVIELVTEPVHAKKAADQAQQVANNAADASKPAASSATKAAPKAVKPAASASAAAKPAAKAEASAKTEKSAAKPSASESTSSANKADKPAAKSAAKPAAQKASADKKPSASK